MTGPAFTFEDAAHASEPRCATCGHRESAHEAGECWWDVDRGHEVWDITKDKCRCDWWEPMS